jgi:hypothetical protein
MELPTENPDESTVPKRTRRAPKRPKRETYTIAFRVDDATLKWLAERAAPYGLSIHEYARQRLTEIITDAATEEMREEIKDVRKGVTDLREDLAVTLEVVLGNLVKDDPARIRRWIDKTLRKIH